MAVLQVNFYSNNNKLKGEIIYFAYFNAFHQLSFVVSMEKKVLTNSTLMWKMWAVWVNSNRLNWMQMARNGNLWLKESEMMSACFCKRSMIQRNSINMSLVFRLQSIVHHCRPSERNSVAIFEKEFRKLDHPNSWAGRNSKNALSTMKYSLMLQYH